jgi:quercetin dioxygenase-like cupin family protein/DNA-binding XRE family transcriptional regulator
MLSEAISDGLNAYDIGAKVRALRSAKKLGLTQLGEHTDLSPGMLSRIETGQLFPTLPTLLRIAMVFGVGLEHFFAPSGEKPIAALVRKADRMRLPDRRSGAASYLFESLNYPVNARPLDAFHAEFVSSDRSEPHTHEGAEVIYLIEGQLEVSHAGDTHVLDEGDAIHFDASAPHSYRRTSSGSCRGVVVVTLKTQ